MGFDLHYHEVRRLMYLVESSETSVMNDPRTAARRIEVVASHPRTGPSPHFLIWPGAKEKEFVMVLGHLRDRELRQMWKAVSDQESTSTSPAAAELKHRLHWRH